ncbi:hypothetical protein ADIAG_03067 [Paeniglutamicibacter gangotriensis Lz1y]|uniref:Uncharacterized protein n=2 Tax=Paeniglutamicibacter gangotriensis TaxID=254787 RepID=M7MMV5_9MICC|nr:hypothetical protein ADIAG_03067 [Paeniglutamicibacter gangotriensis Lz1y]
MTDNEELENNLTPSTDARKVSEKQLSKWKGEGGALPADFDPDLADSQQEE